MLRGSFEKAGYFVLRCVATLVVLVASTTYLLVGWMAEGRGWLGNVRDLVSESLHNIWREP